MEHPRENHDLLWDLYRSAQKLGRVGATLETQADVEQFAKTFWEGRELMSQVLAIMEGSKGVDNV